MNKTVFNRNKVKLLIQRFYKILENGILTGLTSLRYIMEKPKFQRITIEKSKFEVQINGSFFVPFQIFSH